MPKESRQITPALCDLTTFFLFLLDVQTEDVFSILGDVTTKMTVVMVLTNWIANTKIVEPVNSLAKITDVSLKVKNVMVSTIVRTTVPLMNLK